MVTEEEIREAMGKYPMPMFVFWYYRVFFDGAVLRTVVIVLFFLGFFMALVLSILQNDDYNLLNIIKLCLYIAAVPLALTFTIGFIVIGMKNRVIRKRCEYLGISLLEYQESVESLLEGKV